MKREEHHVVHNSTLDCWDVKRNNAERVSGRYDTKQQAVSAAREISRNQKTELIVHLKNGRFQNLDSHGHDPCPPKDKK